MKRVINSSEQIFGISNVLGRFIAVEENVPFSFYYSPRNSSHGPRVKPVLDPNKMRISDAGTLSLCGDWEFVPGRRDLYYPAKVVHLMKEFFRTYLVLFLLVWDEQADDPMLGYYLEGKISLNEFIQTIDFYPEYAEDLDQIETVTELEQFCREHELVNFYGN